MIVLSKNFTIYSSYFLNTCYTVVLELIFKDECYLKTCFSGLYHHVSLKTTHWFDNDL